MNMFAISFAVMLLVILAELAFLKWSRQQVIPWKEVVFNLNSGHILMWVFRGVEVLVFGWVLQHLSLHWVDGWALPWVWLFACTTRGHGCGPCMWCTTRASISICRSACVILGIRHSATCRLCWFWR